MIRPRLTLRARRRRFVFFLLRWVLPRPPKKGQEAQILTGRFTRRALMIGGVQGGLMALLAARLYELQITYSPRYRLLAEANRINTQNVPVVRGGIRDRFGVVLAESLENLQAVLIPDLADDLKGTVQRLDKIITLTDEDRQRLLEVTAPAGAALLVENDARLAARAGADGVHVAGGGATLGALTNSWLPTVRAFGDQRPGPPWKSGVSKCVRRTSFKVGIGRSHRLLMKA